MYRHLREGALQVGGSLQALKLLLPHLLETR